MALNDNDAYSTSGGDEAWEAWLDLCSVAGVQEQKANLADGLKAHIVSAMMATLAREGFAPVDFESDDPVSFFDSYFLLGSERAEAKAAKPLKQFYKFRMANEGIPLKEFVCGVLFSKQRGKIKDIVRKWIETVKGWRPHTLTQGDGRRKIVWESAVEKEENVAVGTIRYSFGSRLDVGALKRQIDEVFSEMEKELKLEKVKIALLLYMTAQDETLDNQMVLDKLGVGKSRAYTLKDKCMEVIAKKLKKREVQTDDIMFARLLMASCKTLLGGDFINTIEE